MAQVLVQFTLPHKAPAASEFSRSNGHSILTITAPSHIGLPYGRYPRIILAWLSTEVVRRRSPVINLGRSLSSFMRAAGVEGLSTGGPNGSLTRFSNQLRRLFASTIHCSQCMADGSVSIDSGFSLSRKAVLWWTPSLPQSVSLFGSYVELSEEFYQSIVEHPVPIDLRVLRELRSPFALDIYIWLTYRMSYLRQPCKIPWHLLEHQFGADYSSLRHFRAAFLGHAVRIQKLYPAVRLTASHRSLILFPSPTHIPQVTP